MLVLLLAPGDSGPKGWAAWGSIFTTDLIGKTLSYSSLSEGPELPGKGGRDAETLEALASKGGAVGVEADFGIVIPVLPEPVPVLVLVPVSGGLRCPCEPLVSSSVEFIEIV